MYTNSLDYGKTWKKPVELVYYRHKRPTDIYFRPFGVANHKLMPNSVFLSFVWNNEVFLKWTLDNGKTWSRNLPTRKGTGVAPRITLCPYPNGEKARLYMLFAHLRPVGENYFVMGSLNFNSFMYKDEEYPFKGYLFNWAYFLDCEMENKQLKVSAMIESYMNDKSHIFFSQKTDFTTEENSLQSRFSPFIFHICLLYTSDAADDTPCVDLGGRRIIKKKKKKPKKDSTAELTLTQNRYSTCHKCL
eukprot:TRINITY_DN6373_c0_g1_i12.p1 TRINITY_DN6373_c0_g1~~TRINITY_DN6373_c0_g1_i12.p1  ORF type:complete len:256 (+),score=41.62 TRINITY_DN6373_c0_g1_i12:32-769(+)